MSDRIAIAWATCFIAVGAVALVIELGVWTPRAGWVWPLLLMVLGLALLVAGAVGRDGDHRSGS